MVDTIAVYRRCLELLANTDLEWLQERVVLELSSSADAQSAGLWMVDERNELRLRSYRGLLDKHGLGDRLTTSADLQARLREGQPWRVGEGRDQVLWVPLTAHGEPVGLAQLADPLAGSFSDDHASAVKLLADFASVGLRNGRKFLQLQRLGLRDRDSAAYNLSYFTDYASKEIYKARRYGRIFSLLIFSLDQLPAVRARQGPEEARKGTRAVIRALARIVRDSDVIAKASEQEFYILLPETDFFGASMFVRRAMAAAREEPEVRELEQRGSLGLSCGGATFPKDGEDFDELVHRCRERADERRASLHRTLHLEPLSFWDQVEVLLGSPGSPGLPADVRAEPSRRGKFSGALFADLQAEVARELARDPHARGLLYVGGPEVRASMPLATALEAAFGGMSAELAARVYALGRRADLETHPVITPVFLEGDERIARHEFLLWLSDSAAYALLQRPGHGVTWGFHTSDTHVVDGLITKLQAEYDLQPY
jgi:diguanylate cyclase (GGDEF)-like protein